MNPLRSPCLLLATLGAVAGCGVNTAILNPLDGGTVADAPASEPAVNDAPTRDTLAVVADVAADAGNPIVDAGTPQVDVPAADTPATGALGTCASPVDLGLEGTVAGTDLVFRGVTTGLADVLHPYPGCVAHDAAEMVMTYRVPAGAGALMFTTEGSAYDTVLYVRAACSQAKTGVDTTCNNDSYDHAPQSTVYVTNAVEGQTLFLIVDGNTEVDTVPTGSFVLTARRVPFGGSGQPCNPVTDPATARCSGALRCSEGGAADGTAICVPVMGVGTACDARGFTNICAENVSCVTDPAPVEGVPATSACALAGTRWGAPCRAAAPRCDGAFACSAADPATCVPSLSVGIACDPTGEGNRCATGLVCSPLGDGGASLCH